MPAPVNRLDLATRRGITAQTVIQNLAEHAAEQSGQAPRNPDSIAERIGNAALAGLLRRFEEDGLLSPAASANGGMAMKDVVEAFKAVHEVARDQDDRRYQRMRELQEENDALRGRLQAQDSSQTSAFVEILKLMGQMQQNFQQQVLQLIDRMESRTREMIQELRQYIDRNNQDAPRIERLLEEFKQASDPVVLAQKYKALREAFGLDSSGSNHAAPSLPLELLPEYWKTDLERYRIKLQHDRDLKEAEAAERRATAIEKLLQEIAQSRAKQAEHSSDGGAGASTPAPKPPARYRYLCDACGKEFILAQRISHTRCPYCSAELEVVTDGNREAPASRQPAAASHPAHSAELDSESGSL